MKPTKPKSKAKRGVDRLDGIPVYCRYDEAVDIDKITGHPRNPNKHGDEQIALLAKIIKSSGWRNPICVSNRSGFVIKGHGRLMAARVLGASLAPVEYQDYESEAAEYNDLIADNRIAELSKMEGGALLDLLKELDNGKSDLELTGFTEAEIQAMMIESEEQKECDIYDQSVQMEPAKEFLCILLNPEDVEDATSLLGLKRVRRGGYKNGSSFDSTGIERCIKWGRVKNAISNTK